MNSEPTTPARPAPGWSRRDFLKSAAAAGLAFGAPGRGSAATANDAADPCRIVFDLDPDPKNQPVLDWLKRGGYCWGIEAPWQTPTERLRWLRAQGWELVLKLKAHPATQARHHAYKKWPIPDSREILQRHFDAASGDRKRVIWQILLEDDSAGVGHAQELMRAKPRTHAEAAALLESHVAETVAASLPEESIRRWGVCGFAATAHAFARQSGVDLVTVERANDDVDDLQTGIAFARGAGRQYAKLWGIDLSLWWGVIHGTVANLPPSYHRRHLYLSWYAGAQHFRIEGGDLFLDRRSRQPLPLAHCMDEFGRHTQRHERGVIETPVAVMLPADHGWITPPPWRTTREVWNYARVPYRQGQRALDGFFGAAFPGSGYAMQPFPFGRFASDDPPASPFALSSVTPPFAPAPTDVWAAEPPLPFGRFKDRRETARSLREGPIDPSPYRPMGHSRWGDILDVLTADAEPAALERYHVLVLLDQVRLEPAKLAPFLARGGTML
ncbi:MAG: twin-arginine translocation signal domain-containing protein, partial [Verrucomicrobia bacterium]|nr:twin-arginine translocation signal domain-containing protein [Verrucomicrobiota bacterium]